MLTNTGLGAPVIVRSMSAKSGTTGATAVLRTVALRLVPEGLTSGVSLVTVATLVKAPADVGVTVTRRTTPELALRLLAVIETTPLLRTGAPNAPSRLFVTEASTKVTPAGRVSDNTTLAAFAARFVRVMV